MGLFTTKCQVCDAKVSRRARYCSRCGSVPEGSSQTDRCWRCKKEVSVKSDACPHCGADLLGTHKPDIVNNQWLRRDDEFAVRVDVEDVPGFLKKELCIESGTKAAFILDGQLSGEVGPGWYPMGGLATKIPGLSHARRATAILTDAWDTELEFTGASLYTRDPIAINVRLSLIVKAESIAAIKGVLMREKKMVSINDLRGLLAPQVRRILHRFVKKYSAVELDTGATIRQDLESELRRELEESVSSAGMTFKSVRAIDFYHEKLHEQTQQRERLYLQVVKEEAELEHRKRLFDVANANDLEEIRQESAKLENLEKRMEVWSGMIDAAQTMDMKVLNNEAEFRKFKNKIDKENVLEDYDLQTLIRDTKTKGYTEEESRKHAIALLKMEQFAERERFRMIRNHELKDMESEHAFEEARTGLLRKVELEEFATDAAIREMNTRTEAELQRRAKMGVAYRQEAEEAAHSRRSISMADFYMDLEKELKKTEQNLSLREKELALKNRQEAEELKRFGEFAEIGERIEDSELRRAEAQRDAEHTREMEAIRLDQENRRQLLEAMQAGGEVSDVTKAAISGVTGEALEVIREALKVGEMRNMTEQQIAAMAAEKNPAVLKDLAEVLNRKQDNAEVSKLYERIIDDQRRQSDKHQDALERMMRLAIESQKEIALGTRSESRGPTIVVPGGSGAQVINADAGTSKDEPKKGAMAKSCPHCQNTVDANLDICPNCSRPMT